VPSLPLAQLTISIVFVILTRNHSRLPVFYSARPAGAREVILVNDSVDEATLVEEAKNSPEAFGLLYEGTLTESIVTSITEPVITTTPRI